MERVIRPWPVSLNEDQGLPRGKSHTMPLKCNYWFHLEGF